MRPEGPWYGGRPGRGLADPQMRVGDAERNQVAEALSQHFSDGRLDGTEMKERLDRAMGAKTRGDLAGLLSDLPPLGPPPTPVPRRHRVGLWLTAFAVLVFLSVPWQDAHWLWFPRVPWLLIGLVGVFLWRRGRRRHRLPAGG
ncbi:MAG: DUF1707 SHOCT-like domain-containing protein [Acidimicrobiales bacterium]